MGKTLACSFFLGLSERIDSISGKSAEILCGLESSGRGAIGGIGAMIKDSLRRSRSMKGHLVSRWYKWSVFFRKYRAISDLLTLFLIWCTALCANQIRMEAAWLSEKIGLRVGTPLSYVIFIIILLSTWTNVTFYMFVVRSQLLFLTAAFTVIKMILNFKRCTAVTLPQSFSHWSFKDNNRR